VLGLSHTNNNKLREEPETKDPTHQHGRQQKQRPSKVHPRQQHQQAGGRQIRCRRGWIIVLNTRRSPPGAPTRTTT